MDDVDELDTQETGSIPATDLTFLTSRHNRVRWVYQQQLLKISEAADPFQVQTKRRPIDLPRYPQSK